jgi:Polyketide cyclase / dehydrase and lipid transport
MPSYQFLTIWKVQAEQEKVWDLIFNSDRWPDWWRGVEKVEHLRDGDANHVGAVTRYTWKSKLPYQLESRCIDEMGRRRTGKRTGNETYQLELRKKRVIGQLSFEEKRPWVFGLRFLM